MSRRVAFTLVGTVVGAAVSLWAWREGQAELAAGVSEAGVGFGVSHVLFIVSFPWSIAIWALMIAQVSLTGVDGAGGLAPFYAMPILAGAGWGWMISFVPWRRRRTPPPDSPA